MSGRDKSVERFRRLPKDFTFEEAVRLLSAFGYTVHNKGATSGSRIRFRNESTEDYIDLHRPHPGSIMKGWMMKEIHKDMKGKGPIK